MTNSMTPLVSILITVHTRMNFLPYAIESARNQSFPNREIIVVDDSGYSAAEATCKPHVDAGSIRYLSNAKNVGIALSLRAAIDNAAGKYVAILNDDDLWEADFLTCLIPPLEESSRRVLAFSDHWIIDENSLLDLAATDANTRHYGRSSLHEGDVSGADAFVLVMNGVPLAMACVFRKDALDLRLLTPDVAGAYDFWISCALAASGGAFYYVPRRLTRYRVHSRMETGRRSADKSDNNVYIWSQLLERGWFPGMEGYVRTRLSGALFRAGRDRMYFGQLDAARACFRKAFSTSPGWRPVAAGLLSYLPHAVRKRLALTGDFAAQPP